MPTRRSTLIWTGSGLLPRLAQAQQVMRISTLLEQDPATMVAERVMREAYRRMGFALEVQAMPGERSLISANAGETDGELYRKAGIDKLFPNLVRVPTALLTYEIVVFTKTAAFEVKDWSSLRPYKIGFVKGIKIIEENTAGMQTEPVTTMHQAFTKLDLGRTDIVLANRLSGLMTVRAHQFPGVKLLLPPLASFPVFHYLNRHRKDQLAQLSLILKNMEQERAIQRIQEDVLSSF